MDLPKVLLPPPPAASLPDDSKWLAGEGAGSWFHFSKCDHGMRVVRYSPAGRVECTALFHSDGILDLEKEFKMDYPSHCQKVSLRQNERLIQFVRIDDNPISIK